MTPRGGLRAGEPRELAMLMHPATPIHVNVHARTAPPPVSPLSERDDDYYNDDDVRNYWQTRDARVLVDGA